MYMLERKAYCRNMRIQGQTGQYELTRVGDAITCSCPSYRFSDTGDCKHLAALRTLTGLPFNMSVTACVDRVGA